MRLKRRRAPAQQGELGWLVGALEKMPVEVRRAFLLRKQHELSHQKIAAEMGIPVETVAALLHESVIHLAPPGKGPPDMKIRGSGTRDELLAQLDGLEASATTQEP